MSARGRHHRSRDHEASQQARTSEPDPLTPAAGNQAFAALARAATGTADAWAGQVVPADIQRGIDAKRGGGQPLDRSVAQRLGPQLGDDLSDVRVHTDDSAARLSRSVQARAFTTGRDVFFGPDEYRPGSGDGDKLLAHELAHVVQQRRTPTSGQLRVSTPGDAQERQADAAAEGATVAREAADGPRLDRFITEALVYGGYKLGEAQGWWGAGANERERPQQQEQQAAQERERALREEQQKTAQIESDWANEPVITPGEAAFMQAQMGILDGVASSVNEEVTPEQAGQLRARVEPVNTWVTNSGAPKKNPANRDKWVAVGGPIDDTLDVLMQMSRPNETKALVRGALDAAVAVVETVNALPVNDDAPAPGAAGGVTARGVETSLTTEKKRMVETALEQVKALRDEVPEAADGTWDAKDVAARAEGLVPVLQATGMRKITVGAAGNVRSAAAAARSFGMDATQQAANLKAKLAAAVTAGRALATSTGGTPPGAPGAAGGQTPTAPEPGHDHGPEAGHAH